MQTSISLKQISMCVWILEELRNSDDKGLTLSELDAAVRKKTSEKEVLTRSTLTRRRKDIELFFGIIVASPDKKHYRIMNPEQLAFDSLANDLLASVQEYLFLDEYRDLGPLIQPSEIRNGMEFLHTIGDALRNKNKLKIRYHKFTDENPYDAIVHPYCLKASLGRWYLVGAKEGSHNSNEVQCFALDRTLNIKKLEEVFIPNKGFDPSLYFQDSFGVWVDKVKYPVRDITIAVEPKVASYLRTLPLHHSQREQLEKHSDGRILFSYHISPTPDFIGELSRWREDLEIVYKE